MKKLIVFGFLFYSLIGYSQKAIIEGIVIHGISSEPSKYINIILLNSLDKKMILNALSDSTGRFEIKNISAGDYILKFNFVGYQSYELNIKIYKDSIFHLNVNYPCPNGSIKSKKVCPYGHKNNIIPITYGLPTNRTLKKAKEGKTELGGCMVTECDPKWHCKKHDIDF